MGKRRRRFSARARIPKFGAPAWYSSNATVTTSQLAPNNTVTLFDPGTLLQSTPLSSGNDVLIRRCLIRLAGAIVSTVANQLLTLVVTLLVRRAGEAQFFGAFGTTDSQQADVLRTESRSLLSVAGATGSLDTTGGTPWEFDCRTTRKLQSNDTLVLAANLYVSPGWSQAFGGAVITAGLDIQLRILHQRGTGM